jgi:hypothetical protein
MKPLDQMKPDILIEGTARTYLSAGEFEEFRNIPEEERKGALAELLEKPIASFTVINELYFRTRWAGLIDGLYGSGPIRLLEIASGDADMIPQALSRSNPGSRYITANMNQLLNESMLHKTQGLNLEMQLIDDDASAILQYIEPCSVDLIAFQHAVNDVLQAILCAQHDIDTVYSDWMAVLPDMIKLLQVEVRNNSLENSVKSAFLSLIRSLLEVLKQDGLIAINHYMFQLDLDWGYPAGLFEHMLLIIRPWLDEIEECGEITIDGFDPQWWIFIKKK